MTATALHRARFADVAAPEPAWKALHREGDALVIPMRRWVYGAFRAFVDGISTPMLEAAVVDGGLALTEELFALADALDKPSDTLLDAVQKGGIIGADQVPSPLIRADGLVRKEALDFVVDIDLVFDVDRPEALALARVQAARLVSNAQDSVIKALRALVSAGIADKRTVQMIARDIRAMGDVLGLDPASAAAVNRLRATMEKAGQSQALIARTTSRYAAAKLRQRSMTIARHEVMTALNGGQRQAWDQATQRGLLGPGAEKVWIVTPDDRLCQRCAPQEGLTAPVGQPYQLRAPEFGSIMGPPLHVVCRCAEGMEP